MVRRHDEGRVGRDRSGLLRQFDGLEEEMRSAIAPDRRELDEDALVGPELDAVLGERGAEAVAAELFEAGAIGGGTQAPAWRSKPSSWTWRGPRELRWSRVPPARERIRCDRLKQGGLIARLGREGRVPPVRPEACLLFDRSRAPMLRAEM